MINGTELLNCKFDLSTESYINVYKMIVEILKEEYKVNPSQYFLEFIDYTDNYTFYTLKTNKKDGLNEELRLWAFDKENLFLVNESFKKAELLTEFKKTLRNEHLNVKFIDLEGKK
ncbi:MAG: hypothetical protein IJS83_00550 [Acholeplasmatales bacterium]|nr:hypothetical protein [Acholeplasmatales bacterium]